MRGSHFLQKNGEQLQVGVGFSKGQFRFLFLPARLGIAQYLRWGEIIDDCFSTVVVMEVFADQATEMF